MQIHPIRWALAVVLVGCATSQPPIQSPPTEDPVESGAERKAYTAEECAAHGGTVIGDIGDGATHRPDYICPSGKRPLGDFLPPKGGPIPVEGAVCCPR
jgi:hypothetical protein